MTNVSLEFFPVKTPQGQTALHKTLSDLKPLKAKFGSVTQNTSIGGSETAQDTCLRILRKHLAVAPHTTCSGSTKEETLALVEAHIQQGVTSLVAIRGDSHSHVRDDDYFASSLEMVSALSEYAQLEIYVGAYPEIHPDAVSSTADLDWLKRKLDAGAHGAITQFFFDLDNFFRFQDRCLKAGINAPIIPGILPVHHFETLQKFSTRCGANIPRDLVARFENTLDHHALAIDIGTSLCAGLVDGGVEHIHFYTLNRSALIQAIAQNLGWIDAQDCQAA